MIKYTRPPQGILPRFLYDEIIREEIRWNGGMCMQKVNEARLLNLRDAITNHSEANLPVNFEWVIEYNQLLSILRIPIDIAHSTPIKYNETWIKQSCLLN